MTHVLIKRGNFGLTERTPCEDRGEMAALPGSQEQPGAAVTTRSKGEGRQGSTQSPRENREALGSLIRDLQPPETGESRFLLSEATWCVVLLYSSPSKLPSKLVETCTC